MIHLLSDLGGLATWAGSPWGVHMSSNSNQNQKLTPKQRLCIASLVDGQNYEQAAMTSGVHTRTIARWRELPQFEQALQQAGDRAIGDAARQMTGGLQTAIDFLLDVIGNETAPYSVRTRAALGLIDRQIRLVEVNEIITRLDGLERAIEGRLT